MEYREIKSNNIKTPPIYSKDALFTVDIDKSLDIKAGENIKFYNDYMHVELKNVKEVFSEEDRCFEAEYWIVEYYDNF